ncbi:MAG: chromate transporter, partial [Bacteroidales bacterium]|nr:chromate transporter [Bacteroidales bacterium]
MKSKVSLFQLFAVFAKIGAFTIGGGYAMIPIIQREMSRRGWIPDDELPDIVALSQSAPGVMAVNI